MISICSILLNVETIYFAAIELFFFCIGMVLATSASHYQSNPFMYIRGLISRNSPSQFQLYNAYFKANACAGP